MCKEEMFTHEKVFKEHVAQPKENTPVGNTGKLKEKKKKGEATWHPQVSMINEEKDEGQDSPQWISRDFLEMENGRTIMAARGALGAGNLKAVRGLQNKSNRMAETSEGRIEEGRIDTRKGPKVRQMMGEVDQGNGGKGSSRGIQDESNAHHICLRR